MDPILETVTPLRPLPLTPSLREKVWGSRSLAPYFPGRTPEQAPIGEAWLTAEDAVVAAGPHAGQTLGALIESHGATLLGEAHRPNPAVRSPYFPILAKLLFIEQKLSVQVHPGDAYALAAEGSPGKTEMWYVVAAKPGAAVALGLTQNLSRDRLIDAARSGEIERYLRWEPVAAGDVIFVPPGLLHTLGPGLVICEIQQNSDVTYRFFDFGRPGPDGRPRDLHVDEAAAVVVDHDWPGTTPRIGLESNDLKRRELLAGCPYFAAEKLSWDGTLHYRPDPRRFHILIILSGAGELDGVPYRPGSCFVVPASAVPFKLQAHSTSEAIVAYEPDLAHLRADAARAGARPEDIARALLE